MSVSISGSNIGNSGLNKMESKDNIKNPTFSKIMRNIGQFALATGKAAVSMLPGTRALSTFFESFGDETVLGQSGGMTPAEMLGIQQEMLQEARMFTLISNVMRIRHDAAMNALRNIK